MNITITGHITDIFQSEIIGQKFEKRVVWVKESDQQYPNHYSIEFQQNDCNIPDAFVPGDKVECKVDVRGRWWSKNGKEGCINTLKCWSMRRVSDGAKPAPSTRQQTGGIPPKSAPQPPADPAPGFEPINNDDDLPF